VLIRPQKYFAQIFSIWVSKNVEFDADFKSVEKVAKKHRISNFFAESKIKREIYIK
jgi:hypothetical protein